MAFDPGKLFLRAIPSNRFGDLFRARAIWEYVDTGVTVAASVADITDEDDHTTVRLLRQCDFLVVSGSGGARALYVVQPVNIADLGTSYTSLDQIADVTTTYLW